MNGITVNGSSSSSGKKKADKKRKKTPAEEVESSCCMFSKDGKCFIYADRSTVKVVQTETGQVSAVLEGHDGDITSICHGASGDPVEIVTCDQKGSVRVWNIEDKKCLKTIEGRNIECMVNGQALIRKAPLKWKVCNFSTNETELKRTDLQKTLFRSRKSGYCFALTKNGSILACASGVKMVLIHDTETSTTSRLEHDSPVTCLAVHPTKRVVLVGDDTGKITAFHDTDNSGFKKNVKSEYHWHATAVRSICFSSDGAHFISGGNEGVLVIWQTDTRHRNFLPRLGGPISRVCASADGSWYAVRMSSHMIRLIDARTLQPEFVLHCLASSTNHKSPFGLVLEPRTGSVVTEKTPGVLQLYDVYKDFEVMSIDVTMRNVVSGTEKEKTIIPTTVGSVAFAPKNGKRMVTVEKRLKKSCMKFWKWDSGNRNAGSQGRFVVTTQVEQPHEGVVQSLLFHPNGEIVISTSKDGVFKVWDLKHEAGEWGCRCVGYYRKSHITASALSQDGSLLALAYNSVVTLWNPLQNSLLSSFTHSSTVTRACFFSQTLLATSTRDGILSVWDVVEQRLLWSVKLGKITAMASQVTELYVVVGGANLLVFSSSKVLPVAKHKLTSNSDFVVDVRPSRRPGTFLYMTSSGQIGKYTSTPQEAGGEDQDVNNRKRKTTSTYALISGGHKDDDEEISQEIGEIERKAHSLQSLTIPSHLLPEVSKLVGTFMRAEGGQVDSHSQKPSFSKRMRLEEETASNDSTVIMAEEDETQGKASREQDREVSKSMTEFFRTTLFSKK